MKSSILYKFVECVNCKSKDVNGIKGLVIDETKNTVIILTIDGKIKTIIKSICWFYVHVNDKIYLIPGKRINVLSKLIKEKKQAKRKRRKRHRQKV